ncbi:ABC transporter substrate-binding protein [Parafrankia colletiae]|uniref:ABC transporter substrate-binding protein n=1 Tax=Parafrankia colletiae TaxID=573497 RepID=A0A1S1QC57_9ACTN|nr:ABC transporter substrate-binding protein [Parafrankia colletiae]MCK9903319.1 ABC transporter substrate-binding protein [Frankia sp. Cpl3]OHV29834.1 ABC transporter substrate-binding protein [Parafrankia colletiae]
MRLAAKRSRVVVGLGLGLALAVTAACGGSDDPAADTTGRNTATGTPVRVGFFSPESGVNALPGAVTGMKAAVAYVNGDLGGIGGHPIEVVSCPIDGTPETTISCANQFVQDGVVAAFDGFNYSSSAGIDTLVSAKIPLVGQIPFDQTTGSKAEGRVFFGAPQASFLIGALQGFKSEGMTSATLTLADTPAGHNTVDNQLKPLSAALGLEASGIYFSVTNPNFSAVASTVASTDPDVAGLIASPNESVCIQLVKNLRAVGYDGAIFLAACTAFIKAAPTEAPGATMYSSAWLPGSEQHAPAEVGQQMNVATRYIEKAGGPADYYAYGEFATVVDFVQGLAGASSTDGLTGETVLTTLKALKDFPTFLGAPATCGRATTPNCTTQMLLFSVQKDLTLKPVSGGWITPSPQILSTIPGAI